MFEKFTSGILKPEIVTSESQQNLRPLTLIVVVVALLFGTISGGYYIYRKSRTNHSLPNKPLIQKIQLLQSRFHLKHLLKVYLRNSKKKDKNYQKKI